MYEYTQYTYTHDVHIYKYMQYIHTQYILSFSLSLCPVPEAGMMVQWVKLLLTTSAFHIRWPVSTLATPPKQLLANAFGKTIEDGPSTCASANLRPLI